MQYGIFGFNLTICYARILPDQAIGYYFRLMASILENVAIQVVI